MANIFFLVPPKIYSSEYKFDKQKLKNPFQSHQEEDTIAKANALQ